MHISSDHPEKKVLRVLLWMWQTTLKIMGGYEEIEPTIKKSFNKDLREIKIVQ